MFNKLIAATETLPRQKRDSSIDEIILQHYTDKPPAFVLMLVQGLWPRATDAYLRNRASKLSKSTGRELKRDQHQIRINTIIYEEYSDKPDNLILNRIEKKTGVRIDDKELRRRADSMFLVRNEARVRLHQIVIGSYFNARNSDIARHIEQETGIRITPGEVNTIADDLGLRDCSTEIGKSRIKNEILRCHYESPDKKELILDLVKEKTGEEPDWHLLQVRASRAVGVRRKVSTPPPSQKSEDSVRLDRIIEQHYADKPPEFLHQYILRELGRSVNRNIRKKRASEMNIRINPVEKAVNTIIYHEYATMPDGYLQHRIKQQVGLQLTDMDIRNRAQAMDLVRNEKEIEVKAIVWETYLSEFNRDIARRIARETGMFPHDSEIDKTAVSLGLIDPHSLTTTNKAINTIIRNLHTDNEHQSMILEMIKEKTGTSMKWDNVRDRLDREEDRTETETHTAYRYLTPAEKELLRYTYPFLPAACLLILLPGLTKTKLKYHAAANGIEKSGKKAIELACTEHGCTVEDLFGDPVLRESALIRFNGISVSPGELLTFFQKKVFGIIPLFGTSHVDRAYTDVFTRLVFIRPLDLKRQVLMELFRLHKDFGARCNEQLLMLNSPLIFRNCHPNMTLFLFGRSWKELLYDDRIRKQYLPSKQVRSGKPVRKAGTGNENRFITENLLEVLRMFCNGKLPLSIMEMEADKALDAVKRISEQYKKTDNPYILDRYCQRLELYLKAVQFQQEKQQQIGNRGGDMVISRLKQLSLLIDRNVLLSDIRRRINSTRDT